MALDPGLAEYLTQAKRKAVRGTAEDLVCIWLWTLACGLLITFMAALIVGDRIVFAALGFGLALFTVLTQLGAAVRTERLLPAVRSEIRANLIEGGLLQMLFVPDAPERLPHLFGAQRISAGWLELDTSTAELRASTRHRIDALADHYLGCCGDLQLATKSADRLFAACPGVSHWWTREWLFDRVLRSAVMIELADALLAGRAKSP